MYIKRILPREGAVISFFGCIGRFLEGGPAFVVSSSLLAGWASVLLILVLECLSLYIYIYIYI